MSLGLQFVMKSDASSFTTGFTTNTTVGHLSSGTTINSGDKVTDVVKSILWAPPPPANTRYESKSLGTWSSTTDVDNFLSKYNHENDYYVGNNDHLSLGNYVTINDGTYNRQWVIAGFDCEHNQTAADGTMYDNGYGILMIPKVYLLDSKGWNTNNITVSYINSTIHTSILVTAANNMRNILGSHMIQRNVLLGSAQSGQTSSNRKNITSNYQWTTAYLTLMSIGQMTGTFASHNNQYDDGEANYKLPLFNYEEFKTGSHFWSRCVRGLSSDNDFYAWRVTNAGSPSGEVVFYTNDVRPLMLLR